MKLTTLGPSMLYWYPFIKGLGIPTPRTEMLPIDDLDDWRYLEEPQRLSALKPSIQAAAGTIGYPLFMRTDLASGKHRWKDTCYVESEQVLMQHVFNLLEDNACTGPLGLPCKALVFRDYIPMDERFRAFWGDMPVNPERRYFAAKGKIYCHHPYWIAEAIADTKTSTVGWQDLLRIANTEFADEIALLKEYTKTVSKAVPGKWSVDFCRAKDGTWYLIDMAPAEMSWHPEYCPKHKLFRRKL